MTTVVTALAPGTRRGFELLLLLLSVGISTGAYALVGLTLAGELPVRLLAVSGGLLGLGLLLHVVVHVVAPYADPVIIPIALLINGIGLVMIHRLDLAEDPATSLAVRQLGATAIGVVAAAVVLVVLRDHRRLRRLTYTAMVVGLLLLLLPLVPGIGTTVNGATIWIRVAGVSFQPAELGKIAIIVFFAGYLVVARDTLSLVGPKVLWLRLPRARDLGPILVAWAASVGILVFERDLGTSLLFFGIFVAMLYVATERVSWIVIGMGLFAAGCVVAWRLFGHVQQRVEVWLDPFDPALIERRGGSYQLVQGLYGMADGGLLGTGLGRGSPEIVPFAESDFIVAALGEELGLAGLFALLMLYGILVQRGIRTAIGVRDGFGKLLACGLAFSIALQVFVVVGGVTRVIPLTGLTMPFLAYGGSSLLGSWIVVALLLRVSDLARRPDLPAKDTRPPTLPGDDARTQVVRLP